MIEVAMPTLRLALLQKCGRMDVYTTEVVVSRWVADKKAAVFSII
jgi:hypothetical protein